jgi:hypothetical protein
MNQHQFLGEGTTFRQSKGKIHDALKALKAHYKRKPQSSDKFWINGMYVYI